MADSDPTTKRSQADKDRSRQQSRAVSGKEAAKGVSGKPNKGVPNPKATKSGARPAQSKAGGGQRPPRKGAPSKAQAPQGPGRSRTTLITLGVVGVVLIVVIVVVAVKLTGSNTTSSGTAYKSQPVTAKVLDEVTNVPLSVYNAVGITAPSGFTIHPPNIIHGQPPLTLDGKPGVLYVGGEFCPYCAAERWAIVTSMSRFGTFTGLGTMQSSSTDVYANTQTFTFATADFSSKYITFSPKEIYSNVENARGTGYEPLQTLTQAEHANVTKYSASQYTGGSKTSSGSIPFMNIGNQAIVSGASYSPAILEGLTRTQIASDLSDPSAPTTQAIIATANFFSASTCAIDSQQPSTVCGSKGVREAAKALGLNNS